MSLRFKQFYYFALVAIVFSLNASAFAQTRDYRATDRQVQILLNRIETRTAAFRQSIERNVYNDNNRNNSNDRNNTYRRNEINSSVSNFEDSIRQLKTNFAARRSTSAEVQETLNRAVSINNFIRDNRGTTTTQNQWNFIRSDLNTLANYYSVSWNWDNPQYPNNQNDRNNAINRNNRNDRYNQNAGFDSRLTGTYRLNVRQSDNVSATINRAISNINYNANQRERTKRNLERRLASPETLMIEKRGQEVKLGSSTSSEASFTADGVSRSETSDNGRTTQVRAASTMNDLTLTYEGDRMNDFYATFTPVSNNQLRITRRVYLENRNETVTVASVYDKIDQNVRWDTTNYPNTRGDANTNDFVVPNNTRLTAILDTPLSTKTAKDGDRFTMTVSSPSQYQGAIIEGRVIGEKSGVVSGRANLSLNFETIRLRNGSTYRFAGIVEQVREPNGNTVSVNNEGTVRDNNQTTKTVTRAGIGAAIGAIIGAVAGGGSGAAIGAGIGAGAGAGSVILQGRDNLELPGGSEFTITATAPGNTVNNQ
jgi:hypothetical protein